MVDTDVAIARENGLLHLLSGHPVREVVHVSIEQVWIDIRHIRLASLLKSTLVAFSVALIITFLEAAVVSTTATEDRIF